MKHCKYAKQYYSKKHIKCARDGSLRCKGCWEKCPHVRQSWWRGADFKETLGVAIAVTLGVILMCYIWCLILFTIRW